MGNISKHIYLHTVATDYSYARIILKVDIPHGTTGCSCYTLEWKYRNNIMSLKMTLIF